MIDLTMDYRSCCVHVALFKPLHESDIVALQSLLDYPLMPPDPKKDDDLLEKPARAKADERVIYEMAELAHQLGFKSREIDALIGSSPDHQIARAALLQARKPSQF